LQPVAELILKKAAGRQLLLQERQACSHCSMATLWKGCTLQYNGISPKGSAVTAVRSTAKQIQLASSAGNHKLAAAAHCIWLTVLQPN
jgi:hypothetical protein